MRTPKANGSFDIYNDAALKLKADHIVANMTDNANFPTPVPSIVTLQDAAADYSTALLNAADLGKNNSAVKNQRRKELIQVLNSLGLYVTSASNGDLVKITSSGYTASKQPEPRYLVNPGSVTLLPGDTAGQIKAMIPRVPGATGYIFEITSTLPADDTVWVSFASSTSKFVFTELQAGQQYWVRVAAIGSRKQKLYSTISTLYAQ